MKTIAYNKFGNTDVLQTLEQVKPALQSNQVLVRVKAFSINPMDWKIRKGEMKLMSGSKFPKNTGTDFAGIIDDIGSSVNGFKIGDEVFGVVKNMMKEGASSEYIAVPSSLVWKKPEKISFTQAASIPVAGTAAVTAIEKMGKINSQTMILVNGATGGFGMFLLQLLKQYNAKITAVTSTKGIAYTKKWGADKVIDYTKENVLLQKTAYDIVIDLSGKMGYKNAKQIMKPKSIFLNPTPQPIEIPTSLFKNLFTGKKHIVVLSNPNTAYTNVLLNAVSKDLDIEVNKVFPFEQYKEAYQYAEKGGYTGKIVVEIQ
ncbi:NAD(P)-dependent alcohol dehydrogenase [Flavobacterium sp. ANB]|uniref:NAD(P)-dependent alcohol dehydrogenase n=1 Tax=unclassified Flavobacterium TaxID=196869 RepID=UPI0012B8CE23|nr:MULTISPECIES: NAD(P)-dependent alcohol dehydrogenase [unclassified Flavobacterium]MBF4515874.1 NAD(P)-dependent alcohol dehydrogenase [Flavobacterium sp. ANB]MTD68876.1 zinc-binding dehydrogenase [Flavobacterium sp. LC2016-13]